MCAARHSSDSRYTLHIRYIDLGHMSLTSCLEIETRLRDEVAAGAEPAIICVEHDPVFTAGRAGVKRRLPKGDARRYPSLLETGVPVVDVDRGGDITWHGPGQLVIHPVLPLKRLDLSLVGYLRQLEAAAMTALAALGIESQRREGLTGTWVGDGKLGFIGIACRKWTTYHGMSINIDCDLSAFDRIVPCGIEGCRVTSIAELIDTRPTVSELGRSVADALRRQLSLDLAVVHPEEVEVANG